MQEMTNLFRRIGITDDEVESRIQSCFHQMFFDQTERLWHDVDADSACIVDTGNMDARTEGMSYGMMMCVQMDRQDLFDKLWQFSMRYMHQGAGKYQGYFAWSVALDGRHHAEGPAPDGEEYFAMALFMADARWGSGDGIFDYAAQAREILRHCLHQPELVPGGHAMWDAENHYIKFVPEAPYTDPSYHLPHFYELFARLADLKDRPFWKQAAQASRKYIVLSAHPVTGMSPEYAQFDGTPILQFGKVYAYYSDAYRVALNIALDHLWFGASPQMDAVVSRLQRWMSAHADPHDYRAWDLDGTPHEEPAMHPVAITAVLAAASAVTGDTDCLYRFWHTPLRTGRRRYYDNCLYFFALLLLAGKYRMWVM